MCVRINFYEKRCASAYAAVLERTWVEELRKTEKFLRIYLRKISSRPKFGKLGSC